MRYLFLKPKLKDLTQGSRIAFARQFRKFTQDEVSEKLGLTGENKRVNMTRYEKGERIFFVNFFKKIMFCCIKTK